MSLHTAVEGKCDPTRSGVAGAGSLSWRFAARLSTYPLHTGKRLHARCMRECGAILIGRSLRPNATATRVRPSRTPLRISNTERRS